MGALTQAVAKSARNKGVSIVNNCMVDEIVVRNGRATGVKANFADGPAELQANIVLSNCNPHHTFLELVGGKCGGRPAS